MDKKTEDTPWLMTAEALWDFIAGEPDSSGSAPDIEHDAQMEDQTPLFI